MKRPRPGRALSPPTALDEVVTVRDLALGGRGVGTLADGRTVFLPRALPGDVVRVMSGRVHPSYVEATLLEWLERSSQRRVPVCADEARCGGCDWMALPIDTQRRHKQDMVRQSLLRVGRVPTARLPDRVPLIAGAELGYRRRVRLHVVGRKLGFFAEGSRALVEIELCHVCSPELWQAVTLLRELFADERRVPSEWLDRVLEVEVRLLQESARPALRLVLEPGAQAPSAFLKFLGASVYVEGQSAERHQLADDVYTLLPPGGFVQVNAEVDERMRAEVLAVAERIGARSALDVYCGVGNFALPLARRGVDTLGLELASEAVEYARRAAREQGLPATFRAGPAEAALAELARKEQKFDLVVVDPPRRGAKGLAPLLGRLCRSALVMISCDPVTLARDVAALEQVGWSLVRTVALDMFPQTHHIESLAEFRPLGADGGADGAAP